jgi:DNA-binding transcriptional MocR family regulator
MTILRRNLLLLQDFIENTHSDWFDWIRPNAGAIAFVQFKGPLTSAELGEQLALRGISMKPAYCFMNQQRATDNNKYFRVGYGEEKMPLALDALRSFVDEHEAAWTEVMKKQREEV